jgi:hypothetical protein
VFNGPIRTSENERILLTITIVDNFNINSHLCFCFTTLLCVTSLFKRLIDLFVHLWLICINCNRQWRFIVLSMSSSMSTYFQVKNVHDINCLFDVLLTMNLISWQCSTNADCRKEYQWICSCLASIRIVYSNSITFCNTSIFVVLSREIHFVDNYVDRFSTTLFNGLHLWWWKRTFDGNICRRKDHCILMSTIFVWSRHF